MLIVPVVLRGIVISAALTDGPLRAVGIVVITAVRPAADSGLRIDHDVKAPTASAAATKYSEKFFTVFSIFDYRLAIAGD